MIPAFPQRVRQSLLSTASEGQIPRATGPFVADNSQFAQQAGCTNCQGLVAAQLSFTSLLAKESKGTILSGVTMPRRNALSQIGCLLAVWSFGATQQPQVVGDALGKRRSASVLVILCGHPPMPTMRLGCAFTVSVPATVLVP